MQYLSDVEFEYYYGKGGKGYPILEDRSNFESILYYEPSHYIKEGLIKSYPIDKAVNSVAKLFNLSKEVTRHLSEIGTPTFRYNGLIEKYETRNGAERVRLFVPDGQFNIDALSKHFNTYGYFLAFQAPYIKGWQHLVFDKKYDIEVTDSVEKLGTLYHICTETAWQKIQKQGLVPRLSQWGKEFQSADNRRVYFFTHLNESEFEAWSKNFYENKGLADIPGNRIFHLLKINPVLLNNVKFYVDPRMADGVYTTDNIPSKAIRSVKIVEVSK